MKPPRKVYVGAIDIRVRFKKRLEGEAGHMDDEGVWVKKTLTASERRDTLLHELLHSVIYISGMRKTLELDNAAEEKLVVSLSPWLLALLRDNPKLVEYLMENREREF